jgi:hypothetical protein
VAATKAPAENIPVAKLKAIWQQIAPADWLSLLQEHKPDNKWSLMGSSIKGLCVNPSHADTSPSFVINLERGSAHCFGASCQYSEWNPIRFYSYLTNMTYASALRKIKTRFNLKIPTAFMQNVQQIEDNEILKNALFHAMNVEMLDVLAHPNKSEFMYANRSGFLTEIRVRRKFPEDAAHTWPVGILPPRERLAMRLKENPDTKNLMEPAFNYLSKYLTIPGSPPIHEGSIVNFFYTSPTTIGRLRIRHPGTKDFYAVEDPYATDVGFFGLNTFSHLAGELDKYTLYVVEGEMDALSIISSQKAGLCQDLCIVATGGAMEADLDQLMTYGFKDICLVPDNDVEGVAWARTRMSKNEGVSRVFRWLPEDTAATVKDIDEAVRAYGFEAVVVRLTNLENIPRNNEWVSEQLEHELIGVDPTDVKTRSMKAAEFGMSLCNDSEREAFIKTMESTYGLSREVLVGQMTPDDDDATSFTKRVLRKMREEYHFLAQKQVQNNNIVSAWSKRKRIVRTFNLNSKSAVHASLASDLGALESYVRREMGMPAFIEYRMGPKGMPVAIPAHQQEMEVLKSFQDALHDIVATTTPKDWLIERGQGIHWLRDVYDEDPTPRLVIVNGAKVFQGVIDGDTLKFEELGCPILGRYFFRMQSKYWSPTLKSVKDIEEGLNHDPKEVFEKLCDVFNKGWRFKNQDLESMFLAADTMYTPVFSVFKHLSMVDISGETQSGKTTLMQIIGGTEFPDLRLCEAVVLVDDFTSAAVRQSMHGTSLRLFLDEFEDNDAGTSRPTHRALAVRDMLELIRGMTVGASTVIRGTTGGESIEYNLNFPVTIGGIFTMQDPRDINRFVHIRTVAIEGFRDPTGPIRDAYTPEDMANLRRGVMTCLLPRIPQLLKAYSDAQQEFSRNASLPQNIMTRLKNHFLPAVAIMKLAGIDYTDFLSRFSSIKMEEMREQGGSTTESTLIWDHILNTQFDLTRFSKEGDLTGYTSLSKILSDDSTRALLNGSDLGAYYIDDKNWLVVFWQKAVTGILKNSPRYRNNQHPSRLKVVADADGRVIDKVALRGNVGLLNDISRRAGTNLRFDQISVLNLDATIATQEEENVEDIVAEATLKRRMLSDIPDTTAIIDAPTKQRGNFEV